MNDEITTIDTADLEHVTGGWAWLARAASFLGSMFSGGASVNAQIGNNQRSAQGNQGPVSLGDGSPVTTTGGGQ